MRKRSFSSYRKLIWDSIKGVDHDFTRLDLRKAIVILAIPMILEMIMESLFALVDIFYVGKLGPSAVATVGLTEAVITIVYSIGIGISMASTALIARRFGEKQYQKAGTIAFQLILFGLLFSLLTGGLGYYFARDILELMGADEQILEEGIQYTQIVLGANVVIMLLFLINGAFRGAGKPAIAMKSLWISNGINIVINPLFIFGWGFFPAMGLQGAALATVIGRGIGVLYQLYHLFLADHLLKIGYENIKIRWKDIFQIIKISLGGIVQFLIDSASWIFLTRLVAEFGSTVLASYTIAFRLIIFTILPAWGLSAAASTLVGQNLGAKKYRRAELSVLKTAKYTTIYLSVIMLFYLLFADLMVPFFSSDAEVIRLSAKALRIISFGYLFFGLGMVMVQAFNGAGDTRTPAIINIIALWLVQIPLAYFLSIHWGWQSNGVFISIAFCHSLHALIAYFVFRRGKWKLIQV